MAENGKANGSRTNGTKTGDVGPGKPPVEHQFKPGNPGRPKGARSKLGEAFIDALYNDFGANGVIAIEKVRTDHPDQYLKVIAAILPKEIVAEVNHRFVARMPEPVRTTDEWEKQHSPNPMIQ